MRVFYLPIEPYEERYTAQLRDWTIGRFNRLGLDTVEVEGEHMDGQGGVIRTGVALDAHDRAYFCLTQHARLVRYLQRGDVQDDDVIYNQDMFAPGYEALPYIIHQQFGPERGPRIYTHCLAQSIDRFDFTFPMLPWMRYYEAMVERTATRIFYASDIMGELLVSAGFAPEGIEQVGLLFDMEEVRSRVDPALRRKPYYARTERIAFTSRWDEEKQPHFYMDLIEAAQRDEVLRSYEFALFTSSPALRSNSPSALERAHFMQAAGLLHIYEGLSKTEYYNLLADTQVQFNCALQDFWSNTLNESSALGTPTLAPCYRSFPEALDGHARQLYTPWSLQDALDKLRSLVMFPISPLRIEYPAVRADATLDRVAARIMLDGGEGEGHSE